MEGRIYEDINLIYTGKDIMIKSLEDQGKYAIHRRGELAALKAPPPMPGFAWGWGAQTREEFKEIQSFVGGPFLYHFTKDNYLPESAVSCYSKYEMAMKLDKFDREFTVNGLTLKHSNDVDELHKFSDLIVECFNLPRLTCLMPTYKILAYKSGKLVGGVILDVIMGSSIVYFNSVLPEYRGQKISKALMVEAIKVAKEKGAHEMVLYSTPLGEAVYKGLGFKYVKEWTATLVKPDQAA